MYPWLMRKDKELARKQRGKGFGNDWAMMSLAPVLGQLATSVLGGSIPGLQGGSRKSAGMSTMIVLPNNPPPYVHLKPGGTVSLGRAGKRQMGGGCSYKRKACGKPSHKRKWQQKRTTFQVGGNKRGGTNRKRTRQKGKGFDAKSLLNLLSLVGPIIIKCSGLKL